MFIRSKFEKMAERPRENESLTVNPPINMDLIFSIKRKDLITSAEQMFYIGFFGVNELESWSYESKEDRDQEHEWIMSILNCKVNREKENDLDFDPADNIE